MAKRKIIEGKVVSKTILPDYITEDNDIVCRMCLCYIDANAYNSKVEMYQFDEADKAEEDAFDIALALERGDRFTLEVDDNEDETNPTLTHSIRV